MARTTEGRLAYANLLRVLATLAAIIYFVAGSWSHPEVYGFEWRTLFTYQALTVWCIPMFAMLSGAFLLDPKKSVRLRDIFLKYILRIVIVLVVWGVIYALLDCKELSWAQIKQALTNVLWADSKYHLWFLFIMLGLYLITPILRAFVKGASRGDLHWFFLLVFLFASLFPLSHTLFSGKLALLTVWANKLDIHLVLGYVGYYVAGYYLKNYTLNRLCEFIIYILGILGVAGAVWGIQKGYALSVLLNEFAPHVVFMTIAVFVLFRYVLGVSDERSRRQRLGGVSKITLGIYLLHPLFLMLLTRLDITTLSFTPILSVPVLAGAIFFCSFLIAWLISKIPLIGRWLT